MTTGCNDVIIAVLDQGVTSNHPDLPNTRQVRLNGSDFVGDDNPSPEGNGNHGNACAGVIAATMNNNQGIAGIAPGCRIMPIRIIDADGYIRDPEDAADGIELAVDNGADILSNSWGYNSSNPNRHPVIVTAIQYAINHNRVVVFSAGNTANHAHNNNGYVAFPANVNIAGVITVGASDRNDHQANYSPTSDPNSTNNQMIDIVAPSHLAYPSQIYGETLEMWSIDIPGNAGYNPYPSLDMPHPPAIGEILPATGTNNLAYTGRFGGTSHSCPVVAGVAALLLSVNPDLSNIDVFNILTSTADDVGGYTYNNGRCNEFGHGRVNAYEAVRAVYPYITGPSVVCTSNSTFTLYNRPPGATVSWMRSKNLIYVSGQGTDNYTVRAYSNEDKSSAFVKATVTNSCGQTILQKTTWVGRPGIPVTTPDGDPPMEVPYGSSFLVNLFHPPGADPSTGAWSTLGSISITTGGSGSSCGFEAVGIDYGQWHVTTSNSCGVSDTYIGQVIVPGWKFSMQPNPANDYVEIIAEKKEYDTKGIVSDTYEVKIFNILKNTVYISTKTDQPLLRIDTKQFVNGTYFIHFTAGKQSVVKQLVINH